MRFVNLAQAALLLVSSCAAAAADDPDQSAPPINQRAPPLVLTALGGETIDLAKLRGEMVLVNYWATWCAPCRKEMPTFDASIGTIAVRAWRSSASASTSGVT